MSARPHAVVTGASSGIGAAIVARLLDGGWRVTGISRRASEISSEHFSHLPLDLESTDRLEAGVARLAPVAFVHAAGFMRVAPLGGLAAADSAGMWRVHIEAAERLANAFAPRMSAGGRIILIGSRTASGAAGRSQYAATKSALVGMARSWAAELAPRNITVNVVAPAATATPMLTDPGRSGVTPKLPPIGRYIQPAEVAATVAFLLSPEAGAITGQNIVICGGASL